MVRHWSELNLILVQLHFILSVSVVVRVEQQLMSRMISDMYHPPASDPTQNDSTDPSESEEHRAISDSGEHLFLPSSDLLVSCVEFLLDPTSGWGAPGGLGWKVELLMFVCVCVFSGGNRRRRPAAVCRLQHVGGLRSAAGAG